MGGLEGSLLSETMLRIRAERNEDYTRITLVHDSAFGEANEGRLVWLLRETPHFDPELSLVAESGSGSIVGHVLFYPVFIRTLTGARVGALALAPLAVLPEYQKTGVGKTLVLNGLEAAKKRGYSVVTVFGNPGYYARFGFRPAGEFNITPPFKAPRGAYMVLELVDNALLHVQGTVVYPREFDAD